MLPNNFIGDFINSSHLGTAKLAGFLFGWAARPEDSSINLWKVAEIVFTKQSFIVCWSDPGGIYESFVGSPGKVSSFSSFSIA